MSKRILVVDDDTDYLASMELQLQAAGYDVQTAENGAAARTAFADQRPDAAIVDLMMDEADEGFGLCYFMKEQDQDIPVIMVSAVAGDTGLEFGTRTPGDRAWIKADAFLSKPVRFEQLQRELGRLLKD